MKNRTRHTAWKRTKETIKERPVVFAVYCIVRLIVIVSLAAAILRGDFESAFTCVMVLVLFLIPLLLERGLAIQLPSTLEIIILLFIFAAEILGELQCYFIYFPHWDTMLHTTSGFLFAAVGFSLIDILNRDSRVKFSLSAVYVAIVAFCFSMTIGVLWEFFEFGVDRAFQKDMQKDTIVHTITSVSLDETNRNIPVTITDIHSVQVDGTDLGFDGYLDIGLYDTMEDLFVNFIGAVSFSVIGYFYVKQRGKGRFARQFIPVIKEEVDTAYVQKQDKSEPPQAPTDRDG